MSLPSFSVRRPVTIIMFFIGIVLLGTIAWTKLPQELFPPITYPQLSVISRYENAAPEEVESLITKIIEEAVGTAQNSRRVSSISREGLSIVTVEFNWGTNMDVASLNVREKIDLVKERLPRDAKEPVVVKYNPFELPVLILSVTGDVPPNELLEICRKVIKDEVEKLEGVASANLSGGLEREIAVEVNESRLGAAKVALTDVVRAVSNANLNFPAGTIKESFYEFLIRTIGEFQKVHEIDEIVVKVTEPESQTRPEETFRKARGLPPLRPEELGRAIRVKDVAVVKDTLKERTSYSRYNGNEDVSIAIQKQAQANTIHVAKNIKKVVRTLQPILERRGITMNVVYDKSQFIREAIDGLRDDSLQGGCLAFLVLVFFLGDIWSSLILATLIPISIWVTFSLMYFTGLTVNLMSLGGLALGIGMLVDAGIVVIENIFQFRQRGQSPQSAAILGTEEVTNALWGTVLTTVAVFLPLVFVIGIAGQLFRELALTVTYALMASLLLSLTLMPALAGRIRGEAAAFDYLLEDRKKRKGGTPLKGLLARTVLPIVAQLEKIYTSFLQSALERRNFFIGVTFLLFLVSLAILGTRDREFLPKVDQGQFIMKMDLHAGTKLDVTNRIAREIEDLLFTLPELDNVTVSVGSSQESSQGEKVETLGSHQAQFVVNLKEKRARSTAEVLTFLKNTINRMNLEDARIEYIVQGTIFASAIEQGEPIVIEIKGHDFTTLDSIAKQLQLSLSSMPALFGVKTSQSEPSPETKVHVIKDRAALHNLSVTTIAQSAQIAVKGVVATKFKEGGREVDVRVRLRPEDRKNFEKLRRIPIQTPLNQIVPISEVAYLSRGFGPSEIKRLEQSRVILLSANFTGRTFNSVSRDVQLAIDRLKIPRGFSVILAGEQERVKESFTSLRFALLLSILLVYMIMAAEFESLWQPFVIVATVPMSLIGVAFGLLVMQISLSALVLLGVILLGGIVVNNGIVLIEYVNILRRRGLSLEDSLLEAGKRRLRPILMTSLTTIFGLLPLALGLGQGAELRSPMALTVMAGLTTSTFLTLGVLPAIFMSMEHLLMRFRETVAARLPAFRFLQLQKEPEPAFARVSVIPPPPQPLPPPAISLLSKRQEEGLATIREKGRITRKEYAEHFQISIPTAARDLKELLQKGYLRGVGPLGPGRWYEPTGK
ncbi:MAG: efflux RND transporter permease subunit, partial [Candidatus Omnitrophica bacterium]|nr:efflux RND transporter permease subunit [Candidatus Omnitrophota bacterium]